MEYSNLYGNISALHDQGQNFLRHLLDNDPVYTRMRDKKKQLESRFRRGDNAVSKELEHLRANLDVMESVIHINSITVEKIRTSTVHCYGMNNFSRDEKLAELYNAKKTNNQLLKQNSWYFHVQKITRMREQLEMLHDNVKIMDSSSMTSKHVTLVDNQNVKTLIDEYERECNDVATILSVNVDEVKSMKTGMMRNLLQDVLRDKYEYYTSEDTRIKYEIGKRKMEIARGEDGDVTDFNHMNLTKLVHDICFRDGNMESTRNKRNFENALVYANLTFVKNIAYSVCSSIGVINRFNDAVSYGFYGLSLAVKKYMEMLQDGRALDVDFNVFALRYVKGYVKSGMTEIGTGGVISTSTYNKIFRDRKNKMEDFRKNNPRMQDEDREILYNLLGRDENDTLMDNFMVSNESACTTPGEDDNSDLWDNMCKSSELLPNKLAEARHYHDLYLNTIREIFDTRDAGGKKIFTRYDIRLFEMVYGFCFKMDNGNAKFKNEFIQSEIADELARMYREEGIEKTFTQPAIVARTRKLDAKILECVKGNPSILKKLSIVNKAYKEMPEYMEYLSNDRENNTSTFLSGELPVVDPSKFDEKSYNEMQECKAKNMSEMTRLKERVIDFNDLFSPSVDYLDNTIEEDITEMFNESVL